MQGTASWFLTGLAVGIALGAGAGECLSLTARSVARGGASAAWEAAAGAALADLLVLGALAAAVLAWPGLFRPGAWPGLTVAGLGCAGLVFLGWRLATDGAASGPPPGGGGPVRAPEGRRLVKAQFLATLSDSGRILFWVTGGVALTAAGSGSGAGGLFGFAVGIVAAAAGWPLFVARRLRRKGRPLALSARQFRIVTSLSGLVLLFAGVGIGVRLVRALGLAGGLREAVRVVFG